MDTYVIPYSAFIIGFFELVAIAWIYGLDKHLQNIQKMMGFALEPRAYWKFLFKYGCPVAISAMLIAILARFEPMKYNSYEYPSWADSAGWTMTLASACCIPIYMLFRLVKVWTGQITYFECFAPEDETQASKMFAVPVAKDSHARLAISTTATTEVLGKINDAYDHSTEINGNHIYKISKYDHDV